MMARPLFRPAFSYPTLALLAVLAAGVLPGPAPACDHEYGHPNTAAPEAHSTGVLGQPGQFTDVTLPQMLGTEWGEGVVWADYDGDSDLDLLVSNEGQRMQLYRNDGGGVLTLATPPSLNALGNWTGVAWADYDNDGDLDLYAAEAERPKHLYRNDGGTFVDITSVSLSDSGHAHGVSWADYDLDGDVDLAFACAYTPTTPCGYPCAGERLLRNDGNDVFTNVSPAVLDDPQYGRGITWMDYDQDGDPDLVVANFGTTRMYRNDGGTLVEATGPPISQYGHGGAVSPADYDNDGDEDLFIAKAYSATNRLYRNDGGGVFVDVTPPLLAPAENCISSQWGDFDNDADLDLYVGNLEGPNFLFRNDGGGVFSDATTPVLADTHATIGVAWADYDADGDIDLFIANNRGHPDRFLRNDEPHVNHWLQLDLEGTVSNRSAIGAKVDLVAGSVRQFRVVDGGSGYNSQNALRLHFGLGAASVVDSLRIRWPSGIVQTFGPVPIDKVIQIVELGPTSVHPRSPAHAASLAVPAPNPSWAVSSLLFELPQELHVRLRVMDLQGRLVRELENGSVPAGRHRRSWDGLDASGRRAASGVYVVRLETPQVTRSARLIRL